MVFVPAGPFMRGCNAAVDAECFSPEIPYREITLSAFSIDKTEVTVAAYSACVDAGACSTPDSQGSSGAGSCNWTVSGRAQYPVNCVDWNQATAYCAWAGKRLPTEAEWEKAARGTDGRKYPWGNEAIDCSRANYTSSNQFPFGVSPCRGGTSAVGSYPTGASPYGALDMAGNVWEWVEDWLVDAYYEDAPSENPVAHVGDERGYRVLRGGSWNDVAVNHRSSARGGLDPAIRYELAGFRCARDP